MYVGVCWYVLVCVGMCWCVYTPANDRIIAKEKAY